MSRSSITNFHDFQDQSLVEIVVGTKKTVRGSQGFLKMKKGLPDVREMSLSFEDVAKSSCSGKEILEDRVTLMMYGGFLMTDDCR